MSYRLFVGNLPMDIKEREIDDLFYKYGRIRDIDLKTPSRPPAYAFVSFDDERDAEDAIRARDGYTYDGYRLRVEFARGKDGGRSEGSRDIRRDERRRPAGRRTEHRVIVTGLPRSASWQDLKDHMRKAGDVIYADVDHNGEGVVEFSNREDMESAVRKLDDTEFKNPFDKSYIRVKFANKKSRSRSVSPKGRSVSRSRSRSRDRSGKDRKTDRRRSSSVSNSRSPSRSRSPSPKRSSRKVDEDEDEDDRKPRRRSEDSEDDIVVVREPPRVEEEEDGSDADLNNADNDD